MMTYVSTTKNNGYSAEKYSMAITCISEILLKMEKAIVHTNWLFQNM